MKAGDPLPPRRLRVTAAPMHVLAQVLHDPNPIHLDAAAAAAMGLGSRAINQGPANLAYVIDMLTAAYPAYRIADLDSRFLANVRDEDEVVAHGNIASTDGDAILCEAWLDVEGPEPRRAVSVKARLEPRR